MFARPSLLLVCVVAVGFAPAPLPKRVAKDKRSTLLRAQGWWDIVSERTSGNVGRNETSGLSLLVKDDTLTYYVHGQPADGWRITIDDGQNPPALDKMQLNSVAGTAPSHVGRLRVQGEVLELCFGPPGTRAPDLSGDNSTAIKFRRAFR